MQRLADAVRRHGGAAPAARRALHLVSRAIRSERKLLLFSAPVRDILRLSPRFEDQATFRAVVASPDEALKMAAANGELVKALADHLHDIQTGEELLIGLINDRVAAWNIVSCATRTAWPLTETESTLPIGAKDAVFTAGYVAPEYRGRRLFQCMYGASADLAATHGASQLWSWCESHNEPSRRAMLAVGFKYQGSHSRLTVLGIRGPLRIEVAT